MNRKMRVGWWFLVMGILCLGLTLGMTCKKTITFRVTLDSTGTSFGMSVAETSDSGYIACGSTAPSDSVYDAVWLVKTDRLGKKTWERTFGVQSSSEGRSVQQTFDGGYIIGGSTLVGHDSTDVWLIKTDSQGNEVWDKKFGKTDCNVGNSAQQASDGGYVIAGYYTRHDGPGNRDAWLVKTDSSGNEVWDKAFGGPGTDVGNPVQETEGHSVQQTSDGGYIIAGSTVPPGEGSDDVFLVKTDASGNKAWDKAFGGPNIDMGSSVQQTSDGGYIVAGLTCSYGGGDEDAWLIKTDASGLKVWDRKFSGTADDAFASVRQTSDGGFIAVGCTGSSGSGGRDIWLVKTDRSGNKVWDRTFGGIHDDWGSSVRQTSDGGYVVLGATNSDDESRGDVVLIKTDADGN